MNIFIDLDGTLYDTESVQKGKTLAHLLLAELNAPLFDNAKTAIEDFCKEGASCFIVTGRGCMDDEEVQITKRRLREDGFLIPVNIPQPLLTGAAFYARSKYKAISDIYRKFYDSDVDKSNTLLIDNDISQIIEAALGGIKTILFAKDCGYIGKETQELLDKLNVNIAYSWQGVQEIVNGGLDHQGSERS